MKTKNLVILASGSGSTFEAIVDACRNGQIEGRVIGLIVNKNECGALERARRLGIPFVICDFKGKSQENCDELLLNSLSSFDGYPDLVVLAGFLALIGPKVIKTFDKKMVNVHPSLLPQFGGKGLYGDHVHRAVVEAGESKTGVTVHYVTAEFDEGPIVGQVVLDIPEGATWQEVKSMVQAKEKPFYIEVISRLCGADGG